MESVVGTVKTRNVGFSTEMDRMKREMFYKQADGLTEDKSDALKYYSGFLGTEVTSHSTIDDNANLVDSSIISYYNEAPKALLKKAALDYIKDNLGAQHYTAVQEGYIYVNDLTKWFSPYCYAFDLHNLVYNGMPFIHGIKINPPKHTGSFVDLLIQTTAYLSNSIAGAVSYPNLFVYMDWFLRKEYGETYTELAGMEGRCEIEQLFQKMIYSFNFPFRSNQSSFTNLSIYDKYFLADLFGQVIYPDGTSINLDSVDKLQKWFANYFVKQNIDDQVFTFPVMTASMYAKDNKIQDIDFLDWLSEVNSKRGTFNIFSGELGVAASCCRLLNDTKVFTSSLGTPSVSIGSTRVGVLNLPLISLESNNETEFFVNLKKVYDMTIDILVAHRRMLEEAVAKGKHPLYTTGWMDLKRQFCTVGFVGLYECIASLDKDMETEEGILLATKILNTINEWNKQSAELTGYMFNIEQVPAESLGITLANKTNFKAGSSYTVLSNQYLPLTNKADIIDRINVQGKLDKLTQGGGILHLNIEEEIKSPKQMRKLIEHAVKKGVIYFAVNYAINVCKECGKTSIGMVSKSLCCGADVLKFIRVVGYLRPIKSFSKGRAKEASERKFYTNKEVDDGSVPTT